MIKIKNFLKRLKWRLPDISIWYLRVLLIASLILLIVVAYKNSFLLSDFIELAAPKSDVPLTVSGDLKTSPSPSPSLLPSIAPKASKKAYVDPDPVVNCGPGATSKQTVKDKSSNCKNYVDCGLNNNTTWTLMLKTECDKKQAAENPTVTTNQNTLNGNSNSYTGPSYPPCTVYYSALGYSQTYTSTSPETCKSWQDQAKSGGTTTQTTQTPITADQAQAAVDQHNKQVSQCRSDVNYKYQGLLQSCNQYGDSSAAEACNTIYQGKRQSEYDACGTTY